VTDRKPNPDQNEDRTTEASATELDEDALENASGGMLPVGKPLTKKTPYET
jgi:hypothetical protein